jgi:hypothetical protein
MGILSPMPPKNGRPRCTPTLGWLCEWAGHCSIIGGGTKNERSSLVGTGDRHNMSRTKSELNEVEVGEDPSETKSKPDAVQSAKYPTSVRLAIPFGI